MDRPQKSEIEQYQFFRSCLNKFNIAAGQMGEVKQYYKIAETIVCLNFAGPALLPWLTPAFEHLRVDPVVQPHMTINVWDTISTGVNAPPPPCDWTDFTDRGDIWGFNSKRIKTAFHWSEYSVNVMDLSTNTGVYWVKNPKAFPYWVSSSPFRTMIQWWMEKHGCQLLHAAAVCTDDGAVLITGKGGSGKSTSALVCLNAGLGYLGDDYVIIKKDPVPTVYSLYSTAKLNLEDMGKFPALKPLAGKRTDSDQEKEVLFLYPHLKHQIVAEKSLKAVFTPQIRKEENTLIEPASFWPIQRAMSFTTMSQLPGVGAQTQKYISDFIGKLPCYTLKPGNDFDKITETIDDFIGHPEKYFSHKSIQDEELITPLISIIIPVFNGGKFIHKAIDNILKQNYPALEILIVDDGSSDNTRQIVEDLPVDVRYFHQPNSGPAAARNRAIRDVSGEYIAFLDVDDLWPEKNLNLLIRELIQNPSYDLVRGYAQLFVEIKDGTFEYMGNPQESFLNYIGAGVYRKSAFEKVGLYDPDLRFGEDTDWFNRAKEHNLNMKRLDEVTLLVRRHEGNMTKGKSLVELNTLKVFKKKLERKRSGDVGVMSQEVGEVDSNHPKISVIIPVYNGGAFISEAINSVFNQHYEAIEVIVVDDGSTDNTAEMVEMTGQDVRYVYQENRGVSAARNKGLEMATGKYIAYLDADDIWMENKLIRQVEILGKKPEIGAVIGFTCQVPMAMHLKPAIEKANEGGTFLLSVGGTLFRESLFRKVGTFDESMPSGEDTDWFLRAREASVQIVIHKEVVQLYRRHKKNISSNRKIVNSGLLKIHKKSLDRRRMDGKRAVINLPKLDNVDDVMKFWHSDE